jgi:hypothetical protein
MNSYMRTWSFMFGIGLSILWAMGLGSENSTLWITWLDGAGALAAFTLSAVAGDHGAWHARVGFPVLLAIGLFTGWAVSLALMGSNWQNAWTFAFGCAFILVGLSGIRPNVPASRKEGTVQEGTAHDASDRFRKSG